MSRLQEFRKSIRLFNLNLKGLQPQLGERKQIHLRDQQLPAELKELIKIDNVEEIDLVQVTIRVPAPFAVIFKSNCKHDKFTKLNSSSSNEESICLLKRHRETHIY